ncbi:MAG: hypothetical protein Q4F00_11540 [bacterium]|nr:hypothetical protein [bacterium]
MLSAFIPSSLPALPEENKPWQIAYRAQISPEISAENITVSDSVQITAAAATPPEVSPQSEEPQQPLSSTVSPVPPPWAEISTPRLKVKLNQPNSACLTAASADNNSAPVPECTDTAQAAIQAFATAYLVSAAFDKYWQGERSYRKPGQETLTIQLQHPAAQRCGPFYRAAPARTIYTSSTAVSADPDIIAHEQGHAILDSYFHYNTGNSFTASAHEAFADVTALVTSLQNAQIRENICLAWENGQYSSIASVIGEGALELRPGAPPASKGLRDLASVPEAIAERDCEEPHKASQRFSCGAYAALRELYERERQSRPQEPALSALKRSAERFSTDFINSVRWLPRQPIISQRDLAQAVLQANRELHAGQEIDIYQQNWKNIL